MPSLDDWLRMFEVWDPRKRGVHCSNCKRARVYGNPDKPRCYCDQLHGKEVDLWRIIRDKNPVGFQDATKCLDFYSMSDDAREEMQKVG